MIDEVLYEEARDDFFDDPERQLQPYGIKDIRRYPAGHCLEIQKKVFSLLWEEKLPYIQEFVRSGGKIQKSWMLADDGSQKSFANVIKIADRIIDPTADEFEAVSLRLSRENEKRYRNLTIAGHAETAEEYWGAKVFRTDYLFNAQVTPYFPIGWIDAKEHIHFLWGGEDAMKRLIQDGASESIDWLTSDTKSKYDISRELEWNLIAVARYVLLDDIFHGGVFRENKYQASQRDIHDILERIEKRLLAKEDISEKLQSTEMQEFRNTITDDVIWAIYIRWIEPLEKMYNILVEKGLLKKVHT